ncbi:hypothetical protein WN48_01523 [Eufriesea mexicana]|uniref:Uncharacterized protein n=1 Tax=Eufriesea mexicana TaxID=516756 RepID=A0A310S7M5_9HYME|nr:hypothetical protein WN48_01523 [Eufriesea mexicana]
MYGEHRKPPRKAWTYQIVLMPDHPKPLELGKSSLLQIHVAHSMQMKQETVKANDIETRLKEPKFSFKPLAEIHAKSNPTSTEIPPYPPELNSADDLLAISSDPGDQVPPLEFTATDVKNRKHDPSNLSEQQATGPGPLVTGIKLFFHRLRASVVQEVLFPRIEGSIKRKDRRLRNNFPDWTSSALLATQKSRGLIDVDATEGEFPRQTSFVGFGVCQPRDFSSRPTMPPHRPGRLTGRHLNNCKLAKTLDGFPGIFENDVLKVAGIANQLTSNSVAHGCRRFRYDSTNGVEHFLKKFATPPETAVSKLTSGREHQISDVCKKDYMQDLYRKIDGAVLISQLEKDLDCTITFQTHSILQRFMLRFDQLQLDCNDHLYIFDGAHVVSSYKGNVTLICIQIGIPKAGCNIAA